MEQKPTHQSYEFFYFVNASIGLLAVLSIVTTAIAQLYGFASLQQNPVLLVVSGLSGLLGMATFVCAIVGIVLFKKWHYPNATLISPVTYLATSIFSGIVGAVVSIMQVQQIMSNMNMETVDPVEFQNKILEMGLPLPVLIVYYVIAVIQLVAIVLSIRSVRKS